MFHGDDRSGCGKERWPSKLTPEAMKQTLKFCERHSIPVQFWDADELLFDTEADRHRVLQHLFVVAGGVGGFGVKRYSWLREALNLDNSSARLG